MWKKVRATLLSLLLVLSLVPARAVTASAQTAEDEHHYLAFASDRHGLGDVLRNAMEGFPETTEYVSLVGDMVGERGGDAPTFNSSEVYADITANFPSLVAEDTSIIWADHDAGVVDDVGIVKCLDGYESGQVYEGKNADGTTAYYVYGIGFYHMTKGGSVSQEAAAAFKEWVADKDVTIPVIVLCHVPLAARRGDNLGATYWNEALNYAATGVEGITTTDATADGIIRNVVYLYGHNHTTDKTEYLYQAGTTMSVQVDTASGLLLGSDVEVTEAYDEEVEDTEASEASSASSEEADEPVTLLASSDDDAEDEAPLSAGPGGRVTAQGITSNIYYTALIPGYLKTSGNATLMDIAASTITLTKKNGGSEVSLGTDGASGEELGSSVSIERVAWGEPTYTWSDDLSSVTATRALVSAPDHTEAETVTAIQDVTKPATCEDEGELTYTASFENPAFEEQVKTVAIDALGHDWGEWVVTTEPTATKDGERTRVCKHDASHVQTEAIPATGPDDSTEPDKKPTPTPTPSNTTPNSQPSKRQSLPQTGEAKSVAGAVATAGAVALAAALAIGLCERRRNEREGE